MLVRKYSVISIIKDMFSEKKMVIIIAIICTFLGALLGGLTYQKEVKEQSSLEARLSADPVEGEEEYITELRNYEESMSSCEEAYALAVEQRDTLQDYVDSSILMKIDPDNVYVAYVAYVVQDNANTGNILNALQSYINDGGLKEDAMIKGAEELEVDGWREVINVGITGNNLFIAINHYDSNIVKEIMRVVKECVESQTAVIGKTQGAYNLVLSNESYYSKIDLNIANTQLGNNNNLKAYENSVSDQLNRINNLTNTINDYKAKYEINEGVSAQRGLAGTLIVYLIVGFLGGIVLSFLLMLARVTFSNKIMNALHLQYSGLTIYNIYDYSKKDFKISLRETITEIEKKVKDSNSQNVCLWPLSDAESNKEVIEKIKDNISVDVLGKGELCDSKDVLVILTGKKDTYTMLEELMQKCDRLGISLLGIIVCE